MSPVRWVGLAVRVCALVGIVGVSESGAQSALPAPWSARDIGSPSIVGQTTYTSGAFTVDAGGSDIFYASDQFRFVYQPISGDVEVTARVDSLIPVSPWTKVGVMIRASLTADSAHGFALVTPANGVAFHRRLATGGATTGGLSPSVTLPRWLRLVRAGNRLTAYASANGSTWSTIASDTVALGTTAYVGLAVTSHNVALQTTALISNVLVRPIAPQTVPAPQQTADIGAPAIAGSATFSAGTYTVRGAGADIWDTSDQFRYVYQAASGDVDIKVRLASLSNTNAWGKAGVMIRESLTAGSRHAFALVTPQSGYAFQRRIDPSGYSDHTSGGSGAAPGWVRLVRTGNRFEAFRSSNGTTWTSIGSDTVPMVNNVYVGLAVSSHNTASAATAVFDGLAISAATAPLANQPPSVSLTSPTNGASFTAPATVPITATASDSDGTVVRVDFYNGNTWIDSKTAPPFTTALTSLAAGTYTITAIAADDKGASTTSSAAVITVTNATSTNKPPTVSLTAPANGASYTAPASISVAATASDPEGKMARVEFYAGSTLLGSDTSSPYSFAWSSVAAGTYTIRAVAYDTSGASASSATVTVAVNGAVSGPPTKVVFQASPDHATLVTSYRLEVFASTANPSTAAPVATSDLGKPAPASNGDITVDRASFFSALAPGSYVGTVSAIGPGGSTRSAPPVPFTR
jgi:regulation of enolase protein 1 (concanavalin A-like superfamily)